MNEKFFAFLGHYQGFVRDFFRIQFIGFVIVCIVDTIDINIGGIGKEQKEDEGRDQIGEGIRSLCRSGNTDEVRTELVDPESWAADVEESF